MPTEPRLSDHQRAFLRAFHTNPAGPPPSEWPSPAILRRWLRRPTFRRAMDSLQQTLQLQSDFHLAAAAAHAARNLADPAATPDAQRHLAPLLRLAHLRQRSIAPAPNEPNPQSEISNPKSGTPLPRTTATPVDEHKPGHTFRLKDLHRVAFDYGYLPRLAAYQNIPDQPLTVDDFQQILSSDYRLVCFLKRYTASGPDKRFQLLVDRCGNLFELAEPGVNSCTTSTAYRKPAPEAPAPSTQTACLR